ncbi:helix-turn-helix domain-containing protein [Streptomyces aculeolatus]
MAQRPRELTPDRSARHLFGFEMRRCRERAGMSLEGLAEVVKYSRSHLARIEVAAYMPLLGGALALFTLDGGRGVAYEEGIGTGNLLEDPEVFDDRRRACDLLRAYALSPTDSADLIRSVREALP